MYNKCISYMLLQMTWCWFPLKGIAILMDKFKEFGALVGFKINKQKMKKLIKI